MYNSLEKHCNNFHLYIFAFDDKCHTILNKLNLRNVTIISLKEFEDEKLLSVKPVRTKGEYCWTCTPSVILFAIEKYELEMCTYVDADLFFYSNPEILIQEIESNSVLITSHNFSPQYEWLDKYGKYCVQFVIFKNDNAGIKVLKWWRDACIDWCYGRLEHDKFGDQKYLNNWLEKFAGVAELKNINAIIAPWNVQKYKLIMNGNEIQVKPDNENHIVDIIFYHFHDFKFVKEYFLFFDIPVFKRKKIVYCHYRLSNEVKENIYKPYLRLLLENNTSLKQIEPSLDFNGTIIIERKFENLLNRLFN